jgi:hypothetical protein
MNSKIRKLAGLMVAVAITTTACTDEVITGSQGGSVPEAPASLASITVSPEQGTSAIGGTVQLSATLADGAGQPMSGAVAWTSTNPGVASVNSAGVVTGLTAGQVVITAAAGSIVDSATVTVTGGDAPSAPTTRVGYYAAPNGTSGGDGSMARPWDLSTALAGGNGRVQPGDTVWLRGGTYTGKYRSTLTGTAGRPIVVRGYPAERAVIDAASSASTPSAFNVSGAYSVFWGFELTNSYSSRYTTSTGNHVRPNVVANYASHTKYINLVVHDGGVAFYSDPQFVDVELVGNVIYNNGWDAPDRGHGHGIYLKSDGTGVVARDNIVFNQFGFGIHLYSNPGSGHLNNIRLEGNVAFNNGALTATSQGSQNILYGGDETADNGVIEGNMTYFSAGEGPSANVRVGFGSLQNGDVTVRNNYVAGGSTVLEVNQWATASITSNTLVGSGTLSRINDTGISLGLGNTLLTSGGATKVFVRANPYERGRGNIVVYNWGRQGSVQVSLSGVVPSGARFEIRNAQNINGAPVMSGTYSGGSVSLPISSVQGPTPVGLSSSRVPSTGTEFGAYVVTIVE